MSQRNAAQARFEQGLALARRGQWDAALAEFLASRELYPTRSATRNAAVALRQLGRNVEALELYERLLNEFADSMPAADAELARQDIAQLTALAAELELRASETGFNVTLDGQQRGTLRNGAVIRLDPGTHTVRLGKEGFETVEQRVSVASGARKLVQFEMKPLVANGGIVIREATGAALDVMVDAILVGKTPWRGNLAPGRHSVALGNGNRGTAPSSVDVKADATLSLTLRATKLDAEVRVEPMPANATVFIDGVSVGNGVWLGRLPSGLHRVEVGSPGYLPFQRDIDLSRDRPTVLRVALERDTSSPLFSPSFRAHMYVELTLGPLMAASLRGGADETCACSERSRPFGAVGSGRVGFTFVSGFGVELNVGYMALTESMTRTVVATGEESARQFEATDYEDSSSLSGPLAGISASFRMLRVTPITARLGLGVASLRSSTGATGTFRGQVPDANDPAGPAFSLAAPVVISEVERSLMTPFVTTELRMGYRLSKRWSLDAGVALVLLFPPNAVRAGANTLSDDRSRSVALNADGQVHASGTPVKPGVMTLPFERVANTFLAAAPTVALRFEL